MADMVRREKGRKFIVLMVCIPLWLIAAAMTFALYWKFQAVPMAIGLALGTLTAVFPGYIGVNAWQKKIQGGQMAISATTSGAPDGTQ